MKKTTAALTACLILSTASLLMHSYNAEARGYGGGGFSSARSYSSYSPSRSYSAPRPSYTAPKPRPVVVNKTTTVQQRVVKQDNSSGSMLNGMLLGGAIGWLFGHGSSDDRCFNDGKETPCPAK
jgi:hypothetical protein